MGDGGIADRKLGLCLTICQMTTLAQMSTLRVRGGNVVSAQAKTSASPQNAGESEESGEPLATSSNIASCMKSSDDDTYSVIVTPLPVYLMIDMYHITVATVLYG